jgi:hypothetical protein
MKKLIKMSLVALFAIAAANTVDAQQCVGDTALSTTKTKDKNGKHKVKVIPYEPTPVEVFEYTPYYGYRPYWDYGGYRTMNPTIIIGNDRFRGYNPGYYDRRYYYYR